MYRKIFSVSTIVCLAIVSSYFIDAPPSPETRFKTYFQTSFKSLVVVLKAFEAGIKAGESQDQLRERFVKARTAYKKIELILEYYFELDITKINGPPIDFIEEEDPNAYHQPQGFQMIESLLYPEYDTANKSELLNYANLLSSLCEGLLSNSAVSFEPQEFILEATMEETYRILALGITGFDSPAALNSLSEAAAAMSGVDTVLSFYADHPLLKSRAIYSSQHQLIKAAIVYLQKNSDFNSFDRMAFIQSFLIPLSRKIGEARTLLRQQDNAFHHSLISKKSDLFAKSALRRDAYLFDDTITLARINLGKKLFSEPLLSANGKRSCASCHQPTKAFTDGRKKALELDGHTILQRNSPTLLNAAFQHNLFYDSRQVSLDQLINEVLGNAREMNIGPDSSVKNLQGNEAYLRLYRAAYPFEKHGMKAKFLVNAISMYLRTLVSYDSKFDKHMRGSNSLSRQEISGFNLFMGKARCATCHFAPLFNGSKPPTYYYQEGEVIGVPETDDSLNAVLDPDLGRYNILQKEFLKHSFKTPTLRNIALTAPYMHNGVFKDLKAVVHFYNKGGGSGLKIAPPNQTLPFDALGLSSKEEEEVIAFLRTLTDVTR